MNGPFEAIWLAAAAVLLAAPLGYAVGTLLGLRGKRVYPLLRSRGRDGRLSLLTIPEEDLQVDSAHTKGGHAW